MDWSDFFFGVVAGTLTTTIVFALVCLKVMRPFMRAAQRRADTAASMTPPINWNIAHGDGNDPEAVVWPPTKGGKGAN